MWDLNIEMKVMMPYFQENLLSIGNKGPYRKPTQVGG